MYTILKGILEYLMCVDIILLRVTIEACSPLGMRPITPILKARSPKYSQRNMIIDYVHTITICAQMEQYNCSTALTKWLFPLIFHIRALIHTSLHSNTVPSLSSTMCLCISLCKEISFFLATYAQQYSSYAMGS